MPPPTTSETRQLAQLQAREKALQAKIKRIPSLSCSDPEAAHAQAKRFLAGVQTEIAKIKPKEGAPK